MSAHELWLSSRLVDAERKNRSRVTHVDRRSKIIALHSSSNGVRRERVKLKT